MAEPSSILREALSTLARTAVLVAGGTLVLGAACFVIAWRGVPVKGLAAALTAVALAVPAGAVIAWQRALAAGALGFARSLGLAPRIVDALFAPFAGAAGALPAAAAEEKLRQAVAAYTPGTEGGALRGAIERRLVAVVERVALIRFRTAGGNVDPDAVKVHLAGRIDDLVAGRVRASTRTTVVLVASGAVVAAIAAAVALRAVA